MGARLLSFFFRKRLFEEEGRGFEDEKSDDEVGRRCGRRMRVGVLTGGVV